MNDLIKFLRMLRLALHCRPATGGSLPRYEPRSVDSIPVMLSPGWYESPPERLDRLNQPRRRP